MSAEPPEQLFQVALALLPALAGAAFASASAAAGTFSAARRSALRDSLEGRSRLAVERYIEKEHAIEARWLVWRVLGIVASALLVHQALPDRLGAWRGVAAGLVALIAYGMPSAIGRVWVRRSPERALPWMLIFLYPLEILAVPLAAPISAFSRLVGPRTEPTPEQMATGVETEVELIIHEGELNGSIARETSEMIRNALEFNELTAGDVMVPRTQVTAFDVKTSMQDVLKVIRDSKHSRYPVFEERIDNVVGVLHVKDMVDIALEGDIRSRLLPELIRQPVVFVPESQSASSVLRNMRNGRQHLAVVIDEFGGFAGLVTLEDLVEEIVGDIRDEHDTEEPPISDLGDGRFLVDAAMSMTDLARYLGTEFEEEGDYNSVGGFLVSQLERVPRPGATFSAYGLDFIVREADERRVMKVEIIRKTPPPPESMMPPTPSSKSPSKKPAAA